MPEAETPNNAASAFDVPRHVAIIMDGNGRWAAARGLPRAEGHRRGVEALRRTIRGAGEIGIKIVTIVSDGWERGDVGLLEEELARLQRTSRTLLWLNPLAGDSGYEPLAAGMAAALRHVDGFLPAHNIASLEGFVTRLAQLE